MTTDLTGRAALVTGASRNIGRAIATALAARGADIAIHVGRDTAAGEETAAAVRTAGRRAVVIAGDLADPAVPPRLVGEATEAFGRLDILVNNAAIRPEAAFERLSYRDWREVFAICLDAAFLATQAALPHLERSDNAAVVNIGGLTGHTGAAHRAHVIAAKAGLVGLTKALAHEFGGRGITVNCVAPGLIETVRAGEAPKHHGSRSNLVGRRGTPEEVAEAVAFLASPSARYVTGETLHVNGGAYLS